MVQQLLLNIFGSLDGVTMKLVNNKILVVVTLELNDFNNIVVRGLGIV